MLGRTRSLACEIKKHTSIVTTGSAGAIRRFLRNGFNGFLRALSGDRAFLSPSPARSSSRTLNVSVETSRPHDFAVRLHRAFVFRAPSVHRIPPTFATMANAPPVRAGWLESIMLRLANDEAKYF